MSAERPGYPNQPSYPSPPPATGGGYGAPAGGPDPGHPAGTDIPTEAVPALGFEQASRGGAGSGGPGQAPTRTGQPGQARQPGQPGQPHHPGQPGQDHQPGQFPGQPQPGSPAETAGIVRGLQAWMVDLDHKLAIRTKLLLGLVAVAIGIAGAALYLAVEANRTTASQEEFAELKLQVEELQQQLGIMPTESELEDATGAIEGAAEDADAAAEDADQAADDADSAAGAADDASKSADQAEQGAADDSDASAIIEEAMKERFDELSEDAPPMPEIGSN